MHTHKRSRIISNLEKLISGGYSSRVDISPPRCVLEGSPHYNQHCTVQGKQRNHQLSDRVHVNHSLPVYRAHHALELLVESSWMSACVMTSVVS
ncbi:hypothetical protein FKM82_021853 [Ascaphus truei]